MNAKTKAVLWVACGLLAVTSLCPPWKHWYYKGGVRLSRSSGYYWIFAPPDYDHGIDFMPDDPVGYQVDYPRLALEWSALASVLLVVLVTSPRRKAT